MFRQTPPERSVQSFPGIDQLPFPVKGIHSFELRSYAFSQFQLRRCFQLFHNLRADGAINLKKEVVRIVWHVWVLTLRHLDVNLHVHLKSHGLLQGSPTRTPKTRALAEPIQALLSRRLLAQTFGKSRQPSCKACSTSTQADTDPYLS